MGKDDTRQEDAEEEPVVLKVHVVDDQQSRVQHERTRDRKRRRLVDPSSSRCFETGPFVDGVYEDEFRQDDGRALEPDARVTAVPQVVESDDLGIDGVRDLGEDTFKVGKERRVIEGPFRSRLGESASSR